jgi:hypothetical protein
VEAEAAAESEASAESEAVLELAADARGSELAARG